MLCESYLEAHHHKISALPYNIILFFKVGDPSAKSWGPCTASWCTAPTPAYHCPANQHIGGDWTPQELNWYWFSQASINLKRPWIHSSLCTLQQRMVWRKAGWSAGEVASPSSYAFVLAPEQFQLQSPPAPHHHSPPVHDIKPWLSQWRVYYWCWQPGLSYQSCWPPWRCCWPSPPCVRSVSSVDTFFHFQ